MTNIDAARTADRLDIRDIYSRYCRAVDRRNEQELAEIFHPDAQIETPHGPTAVQDYTPGVIQRQQNVIAVSHQMTNVMIDFFGDDRAFVQAWGIAAERRPAHSGDVESDFVFRVRYGDVVERRDGRWAVSSRLLVVDHVAKTPVDVSTVPFITGGREDDPVEKLRASTLSS